MGDFAGNCGAVYSVSLTQENVSARQSGRTGVSVRKAGPGKWFKKDIGNITSVFLL